MSEFKRKIEAYQQHGDRTVINDIMSAVEKKDFMRNRTRERIVSSNPSGSIRISLNEDYEYIAYRIKAMQELIMRHYKLEFAESQPYINEFQRYLSIIYIDFEIKFNATKYNQDEWMFYFNLTPELFTELETHMTELEERFSEDEFRHFKRMLETFKEKESEMRSVKVAREKELEETAISALEYALKYVDTSKSDKEIVKYVNKAFSSKLADAEVKRNGLRRIQRQTPSGQRTSYLVKPFFPRNSYRIILGHDFANQLSQLTPDQRKFIADVVAIIDSDRKEGNTADYTCETDGEVRVSKKYIAEKLGIREDLVRKKLQRIKKKVPSVSHNTSIFNKGRRIEIQ
jgi:hypothetical protein